MRTKDKWRWRQTATSPPQHIEMATAAAAVGTRDVSVSQGPDKLIFVIFFAQPTWFFYKCPHALEGWTRWWWRTAWLSPLSFLRALISYRIFASLSSPICHRFVFIANVLALSLIHVLVPYLQIYIVRLGEVPTLLILASRPFPLFNTFTTYIYVIIGSCHSFVELNLLDYTGDYLKLPGTTGI